MEPIKRIVVLFLFILASLSFSKYISDVYPSSVPKYNIRIDVYTQKPVKSGLVHTLPLNNTLSQFYRRLQCPRAQPNLNYNNGIVSMMRISRPTSDTFKVACAYIETNGPHRCRNWSDCHTVAKIFESGRLIKDNYNAINNWSVARLYRVINGTLKMDWPWGVERFLNDPNVLEAGLSDTVISLIKMTLERITNMKDSVFFTGGDVPGLPKEIPIPLFAHSTSNPYLEIVWPWFEMWYDANKVYKKIREAGLKVDEEGFIATDPSYRQWEEKIPKAAYFATNQGMIRQFMFEVARLHPDLIDAKFIEDLIKNWNPLSRDDALPVEERIALSHNASAVAAAQSLPAGYGVALANLSSLGKFTPYEAGAYKYVVVPLSDWLATSSRLQQLLSHSGAVILMQRSMTKFHISAEFKPWVHFVPLSYSGADIGEKVRWLRDHDDLARQIAENGRNFARSYLRLEDFYCYAASALEMLGEVTGGDSSDAASIVWNPVDLPPLTMRNGGPARYEYPVFGMVTSGSSDAASSVWSPVDLPPLALHFGETA